MNVITLSTIVSGLYCFMITGRHLSFTLAAKELCLTQGAVSHRIRLLEKTLGFPLFRRFTRCIVFTEHGERLYEATVKAFGLIEVEVRSVGNLTLQGNLIVTCPPSFAGCCLVPRLESFYASYPDINIYLYCRNDLPQFTEDHVDLAIHYGNGFHPGLYVTPLMEERIFPVCSPAYAESKNLWNNPEALAHCKLLHDNAPWPNGQYYAEWKLWVDWTGLTDMNCQRGHSFDRAELALQAAEAGLGVAMGRFTLAQRALAAGTLVAPLGEGLCAPQGYSMVTTQEDAQSPRIVAFRNWLLQASQQETKSTV